MFSNAIISIVTYSTVAQYNEIYKHSNLQKATRQPHVNNHLFARYLREQVQSVTSFSEI